MPGQTAVCTMRQTPPTQAVARISRPISPTAAPAASDAPRLLPAPPSLAFAGRAAFRPWSAPKASRTATGSTTTAARWTSPQAPTAERAGEGATRAPALTVGVSDYGVTSNVPRVTTVLAAGVTSAAGVVTVQERTPVATAGVCAPLMTSAARPVR